jgi:hypothetical protein
VGSEVKKDQSIKDYIVTLCPTSSLNNFYRILYYLFLIICFVGTIKSTFAEYPFLPTEWCPPWFFFRRNCFICLCLNSLSYVFLPLWLAQSIPGHVTFRQPSFGRIAARPISPDTHSSRLINYNNKTPSRLAFVCRSRLRTFFPFSLRAPFFSASLRRPPTNRRILTPGPRVPDDDRRLCIGDPPLLVLLISLLPSSLTPLRGVTG